MTNATLPAMIRPLIEPHLPDWIKPRWFATKADAIAMAPGAEIGWFDMVDKTDMAAAITAATSLKWLNSIYAGVDGIPLDALREGGTVLTNGAGINAVTIAEYAVMGMLTIAKGYRQVVRAQERHEWLTDSPGKVELAGSSALLLGYGAIGRLIEARLSAFDVGVTVVRRGPEGPHQLGPDDWRARLGDFDWVILALPATAATMQMIGADELNAMKASAIIINIARGTLIDKDALVAALTEKQIGGAFLDVTDPEPLPPGHPLWGIDTAHITMHLSGRAYDEMFPRSAARFLDNLARWRRGARLFYTVDLDRGY